jgi:hypothetical protein
VLGDSSWLTPLWTTVAGGVIVILCQQTYKWVAKWQEGRRNVEDKDRKLLYEMRDVMMDKPSGVFSKGSPGLVTRFGTLEEKVEEVAVAVGQILEKVQ